MVAQAGELAEVERVRVRLSGDRGRLERFADAALGPAEVAGHGGPQRLTDAQVRQLGRRHLGDRFLLGEHGVGERQVAGLHRRLERAPGSDVAQLVTP